MRGAAAHAGWLRRTARLDRPAWLAWLACAAGLALLSGAAPLLAADAPATASGAAAASGSAACGADLAGARRTETARHVIAWRADPQKILVGRHFAIDIVACAKPGAPAASGIAVDARMPSHGHGMNYKAGIKPVGENRYRAEGLLFHMPGSWELVFDVRSGGDKPERATQAVMVR
ncbi:MAG: hypothetical protein ACK515_13180 [bacterium]|jgi:hypothetical protein|nr:hypothetical protein [Betaproteobacteria bacterium]